MRHLLQLCNDFAAWGRKDPRIRALLWYGSIARGDSAMHSDIDAALLLREGATAAEIVQACSHHFGDRVRACSHIPTRGEATLWMDSSLTKFDLHFVHQPESLGWLADSPDIAPPRLVVAFDKDSRCGGLIERAAQPVHRDVQLLADEEIDKFLIAFEACSSAHRASDGYQFYFQYNLALHRLARLVELCRGDPVYLFLPKLLLPRRMSMEEQLRWRELRGTIYLPEATDSKRRLARAFIATVSELHGLGSCTKPVGPIEQFLNDVIRRDLFFNVRDFADAYEGAVQPRRLFRTSTLTRWKDEDSLNEWLRDRSIGTIIDFRHPAELAEDKSRYPAELLQRIRYISLPLSGAPRTDPSPKQWDPGRSYVRQFHSHASNVVEALREIRRAGEQGVVVHCHAGKDRTGWFCAVLGLLLDLPKDQIVHDYLLSGQGVAPSAIQAFLDAVEASGGARAVLGSAGFSDDDHRLLVKALRSNRGPA